MKSLIAIMSLFSLTAFGAETMVSTNCDYFALHHTRHGAVQVDLYKKSELESPQPFQIAVYQGGNFEPKEIKGLQVTTLKTVLIDKVERNVSGIGGRFHIVEYVYGVKLYVAADEVIGHLLNGCIMQDIKELDTYAICKESHTTGHN